MQSICDSGKIHNNLHHHFSMPSTEPLTHNMFYSDQKYCHLHYHEASLPVDFRKKLSRPGSDKGMDFPEHMKVYDIPHKS